MIGQSADIGAAAVAGIGFFNGLRDATMTISARSSRHFREKHFAQFVVSKTPAFTRGFEHRCISAIR